MPKEKGKHLGFDDRCEIEEMLKDGKSFREIAGKLSASPSTVSAEVKANRVFGRPKEAPGNARSRCAKYASCKVVMLCDRCTSNAACCKRRGMKRCFDLCKEFDRYSCPRLEKAPFVCSRCPKRGFCAHAKARHVASKAQAVHDERMRLAHTGIATTPHELEAMVATVKKLLSQGHSLEAIRCVHGDEFPVCVRTLYNYVNAGVMGLADIDLPKKVRYAPRKKKGAGEPKMDLAGRTFEDRRPLTGEERLLAVRIDCVEGPRRNSKCILTLHSVRLFSQMHLLLEAKTQAHVKAALDAPEVCCEGEFERVFPVIPGDRGSEFLDFEKIERGLDGRRRCRMFCCDPVKPSQKGAAEKNHVELRKILPEGTGFDELTQADVALVSSHVNSYARAGQKAAPIALASLLLPASLLECLGIEAVDPDDVIMTPKLLER